MSTLDFVNVDSSMPMLMIDLAELSPVAMIYLRQGGVTLARVVNA